METRDTKQLRVMKRITTLLETIERPDSDSALMTGRVYRGRTTLGINEPNPALSLLEAPKPDLQPVTAGENKIAQSTLWTLLLQGFATDDKVNPTDPAYTLKGLCEQKLAQIIATTKGNATFPDDYLLPDNNGNKLITGLTIGPGVVRPPDAQVSATAYFYLPLVVNLTLNAAVPFVDD